jgi:imidazole glycerol phosphate synthase glutamine amidotransferase subunit
MIGVIDYGAGNLGSVMNALKRLSVPARFAAGPEELRGASFEKIIFPGDGHFASAMASLEKSGYAQAVKEWIQADRPFLGICIGLQLLFESSEEARRGAAISETMASEVRGLSIIPGAVRRFPGRKVPQIGWNRTSARPDAALFRGLGDDNFFYYIHSYYVCPADDSVCAAETEYHVRYCSAIQRGALAAVQFHPEKSGNAGLALLRNWAEG